MRTRLDVIFQKLTEWEDIAVVQERRVIVSNGIINIGTIKNTYPLTTISNIVSSKINKFFQVRRYGDLLAPKKMEAYL